MTSIFPLSIAIVGVGILIGTTVYFNTTPEEAPEETTLPPIPSSIVLDTNETEEIQIPEEDENRVEETVIVTPTPRPTTPTPKPTSTPAPKPVEVTTEESSSASISFVETPTHVRSGEKFAIRVRINGPSNMNGSNASLTLKQEASSNSGGSSSSVSNNSKQSFGSFSGPTTFESTYSFASTPNAPLHVTASADVNGKIITATRTITIQ